MASEGQLVTRMLVLTLTCCVDLASLPLPPSARCGFGPSLGPAPVEIGPSPARRQRKSSAQARPCHFPHRPQQRTYPLLTLPIFLFPSIFVCDEFYNMIICVLLPRPLDLVQAVPFAGRLWRADLRTFMLSDLLPLFLSCLFD